MTETGELHVFKADPDRVVSVTVEELQRLYEGAFTDGAGQEDVAEMTLDPSDEDATPVCAAREERD